MDKQDIADIKDVLKEILWNVRLSNFPGKWTPYQYPSEKQEMQKLLKEQGCMKGGD